MAVRLTAQQTLASARLRVRTLAPYMTSAVLGMIPREARGLGTLAITERGILLWDPDWVETISPEECAWVLLHEASHLLRDHAGRRRRISAEPWLFNTAGDLEINDDLRTMGAQLPGGIFPEMFGCEAGGLAETYYRKLSQDAKQRPAPGAGAEGPDGAEGDAGAGQGKGKDAGKPRAGGGWCGSGGGHPVPNEPEGAAAGPQRSGADLLRIRLQVAQAIQDHVRKRGQGSVPLGLQVWADGQLKPAKIPWNKLLARAIRSACAYQAGAVDYSYSRPARRQGAIGWGRGKPILPTLRAPKPRVAVAVDTSGSMGREEIERAASEVAGILRATRAEVSFIACDSAVHTVQKLRHAKQLSTALRGGGGTSFVPICEALEKLSPRPDVAVILTDGGGGAPAAPPKGVGQVLWVLVGEHKQRPFFYDSAPEWGTFFEVDET